MTAFKPHCSVDYHEFGPVELETKAHLISSGIYGNDPPFTGPPVGTKAAFDLVITTYHNAYEEYKNGGADQKGDFLIARTALILQMDETGNFVDGLPGVNDDMIILGGYTPTKVGSTGAVIPLPPFGIKITRGISGELFVDCDSQPGAVYYGCLMLAGQPLPAGFGINNAGQFIVSGDSNPAPAGPGPVTPGVAGIIDLTKNRHKHFTGLTKGVEYYFYLYAANAAGVSQLSEVQSLMCG